MPVMTARVCPAETATRCGCTKFGDEAPLLDMVVFNGVSAVGEELRFPFPIADGNMTIGPTEDEDEDEDNEESGEVPVDEEE